MTSTGNYLHLLPPLPPSWKSDMSVWLAEDMPSLDYGGFVVREALREAFFWDKGSNRAILVGTPFVDEISHPRLQVCSPLHLMYVAYLPQSRVARGGR